MNNWISYLNSSKVPTQSIKVATDCSGIEAPLMALDVLGVKYHHVFSSEIDKHATAFIQKNFPPDVIYSDLTTRTDVVPDIDLYVAGFPCQPFSVVGQQNGTSDPRGQIFYSIAKFIKESQPRTFVLENVKGLLNKKFKPFVDEILQMLSGYGYKVNYQVLNCLDYGLPQSRSRVFFVGIRKDIEKCDLFKFPDPVGCSLKSSDLIDQSNTTKANLTPNQTNCINAFKQWDKYKANPNGWIGSVRGSVERFRPARNHVPCLLTNCGAYYVFDLDRYLTDSELLSFMGIDESKYDFSMLSSHQLRFKIGNSICVNVLAFLLLEVLAVL